METAIPLGLPRTEWKEANALRGDDSNRLNRRSFRQPKICHSASRFCYYIITCLPHRAHYAILLEHWSKDPRRVNKSASHVSSECLRRKYIIPLSKGKASFDEERKLPLERVGGKVRLYIWCLKVVLMQVDSTVLAHVLTLLNTRYDYGLDLFLLSIDEGITGYRDDSLEVRLS